MTQTQKQLLLQRLQQLDAALAAACPVCTQHGTGPLCRSCSDLIAQDLDAWAIEQLNTRALAKTLGPAAAFELMGPPPW